MKLRLKRLNQAGFDHMAILVAFVVVFGLIGAFLLYKSFAATTNVNLRLDLRQALCINNTSGSSSGNHSIILYGCSNTAPNDWVLHTVTGGFQIQTTSYDNKTVCLDGSAGVGSNASNRKYLRGNVCSNSPDETWNWSNVTGSPQELQNKGTTGCINDPGGSTASGTALIMFSCAKTVSNETLTNARWVEVAQSSTTTVGGGGSTVASCTGTMASKLICRAKQWGGLPYVYGDGVHGDGSAYAAYKARCENNGSPLINSSCAADCSGFISIVVDDVTGNNYGYIAGDGTLTGSTAGMSHWHKVSESQAVPGDIAVGDAHVEFVGSVSNGKVLTTYGEHSSKAGDNVVNANPYGYYTILAYYEYEE